MMNHPREWWANDTSDLPTRRNVTSTVAAMQRAHARELAAEMARRQEQELDYAHFHYEDQMTKPDAPLEITPTADVDMSTSPHAFVDPLAGLQWGRIVMYTPTPVEARYADAGPWASVVASVGPQPGQCTLLVFMPIPTQIGGDPVARRTEVPFDAAGAPGSWSWPERK